MKKVLVVVAVVFSLALVTSVYAQKWTGLDMSRSAARAKSSSSQGRSSALSEGQDRNGKVGIRQPRKFDYAKYEGAYKGVEDLKVGEKIAGTGVQVEGYNWITRVVDQSKLPVPVKQGVAPR